MKGEMKDLKVRFNEDDLGIKALSIYIRLNKLLAILLKLAIYIEFMFGHITLSNYNLEPVKKLT